MRLQRLKRYFMNKHKIKDVQTTCTEGGGVKIFQKGWHGIFQLLANIHSVCYIYVYIYFIYRFFYFCMRMRHLFKFFFFSQHVHSVQKFNVKKKKNKEEKRATLLIAWPAASFRLTGFINPQTLRICFFSSLSQKYDTKF